MPAAVAPSPSSPTVPASPPASTPSGGSPTPGQAPAASTPASPQSPPINDAFADIDKLISETQQKSPNIPPGAKRAQEKLAREKEKPQQQKPTEPEKPAEAQDKPVDDVSQDEEVKKLKAPELSKAYVAKKRELHEKTEKLTAAENKIKELESKIGDGTSLTKIQEQYEAAQKRASELEERIRFVDYEKSPEYEEKFHQPFVKAYQAGRIKVGSLRILERKNDVDEVIQQGRKATQEDFDALMQIPDDGQAAEVADRLFGPMANLVMYHREKVLDLNGQRMGAIEEFRKTGTEKLQQQAAQMQAFQEKVKKTFEECVKGGLERYPQWFKADDADEQGKQVLEKGSANADLIFSPNNLPPEQAAHLHAAARNMIAGFPLVALKLHRAEARIKELEVELFSFKESEPSERSSEHPKKSSEMSVDAEIDLLAQRGR